MVKSFVPLKNWLRVLRNGKKTTFVTLYTRSSRSIEAARRRAPNRAFLDKIRFSELDYACVHGGRDYKSKSTQRRPCQKNCGVAIVIVYVAIKLVSVIISDML